MVQRKARIEKVAKLIVEALHDLREPDGSSLTNIEKYIKIRYGNRTLKGTTIPDALKNGVECGLINKTGTRYKLDSSLLYLAQMRSQFLISRKNHRKTKISKVCCRKRRSRHYPCTSKRRKKSSKHLPSKSRVKRRGRKSKTNSLPILPEKKSKRTSKLDCGPSTTGVKRKKNEEEDPLNTSSKKKAECITNSSSFTSMKNLRIKKAEGKTRIPEHPPSTSGIQMEQFEGKIDQFQESDTSSGKKNRTNCEKPSLPVSSSIPENEKSEGELLQSSTAPENTLKRKSSRLSTSAKKRQKITAEKESGPLPSTCTSASILSAGSTKHERPIKNKRKTEK